MKMKADAKFITLMSIIDEHIARIFLQATPLKEAIKASIDLSSVRSKVESLTRYADNVYHQMETDNNVDIDFLKTEIRWSIEQCDKYLKMLVPTNAKTDNLEIENSRTVLVVLIEYKQALTRTFQRFEQL